MRVWVVISWNERMNQTRPEGSGGRGVGYSSGNYLFRLFSETPEVKNSWEWNAGLKRTGKENKGYRDTKWCGSNGKNSSWSRKGITMKGGGVYGESGSAHPSSIHYYCLYISIVDLPNSFYMHGNVWLCSWVIQSIKVEHLSWSNSTAVENPNLTGVKEAAAERWFRTLH